MVSSVTERHIDTGPSAAQHDAFRRDGFVVARGLFGSTEMTDVTRWTREVANFKEQPGRHMAYYEDDLRNPGVRVLSRIENFCRFHQNLDQLLNGGKVLGWVSSLLDSPAVMFKDKINFKMPGADGFKAHQDVQAGWDRYATLHITMLLSIDRATLQNGCLEIVSGEHMSGFQGQSWSPLDEEAFDYEPLPTEPGDVVFFDSFVPHRSQPNFTDEQRRMLFVTYNRSEEGDWRAQYYDDKRASYPPDIERDPDKHYVFRV